MPDLSLRREHVPSEKISPLGRFDYEPVSIVIQEHLAERRGKHYDLRIVTPDRAISFVIPWGSLDHPAGTHATFIRMPDHVPEYATFEGQIPQGEYGAGSVSSVNKYRGTLNTDDKGNTFLTFGDKKNMQRIMLTQPKDGNKYFAVYRNFPAERHWQQRQQYKVFPENASYDNYAASEKLDGALVYAKVLPNGVTLTSRRKSVGGETIHKEHHVPWVRDINLPKKYHGMILAGELVHPKGFQFTSAIMNSNPNTAIKKQKVMGRMYFAPHNILNKSMSYKDKIELMRSLSKDSDSKYIKLPRFSDNPEELLRRIQAEGGEGIVLFDPNDSTPQMYKKKLWDTYRGKIINLIEGSGKYKDSLGAMVVTDSRGHTVRVGGGKGLSDELRKKIYADPGEYMGKGIRILASGSTGTSLRQPRFGGFLLEGAPLDAFGESESNYQEYLEKFKTAAQFDNTKDIERALGQAEFDINSIPSRGFVSAKEPVHIRFGGRTHYGVGPHGEHIGTIVNGSNIHIYGNKLFVIRPSGKAFSISLSDSDTKRATRLLGLLRQRSGYDKTAFFVRK